MESGNRRAVLCVDDELLILLSLKAKIRSSFGPEVICETAGGAEEALNILFELHNDGVDVRVVLTDWLMPGMKGDEFLQKVFQDYPHVRGIMVTGYADPKAIEQSLEEANLIACLSKPWSPDKMIELIGNCLA